MKTGIHPTYTHDAKVTCACGNTFVTGSTESELRVEMCSNCHPFYTGKQKLIDTAGRVDRFKRLKDRQSAVTTARAATAAKRKPRVKKPKVEKEEA